MALRHLISRATSQSNMHWQYLVPQQVIRWLTDHQNFLRAVSMIASASLLATAVGIVGSLIQGHFVSPEDLGFVRKYSVISGYAIFLNLGLFSILQKEYPVLIGRGENERCAANRWDRTILVPLGPWWCAALWWLLRAGNSCIHIFERQRLGPFKSSPSGLLSMLAASSILSVLARTSNAWQGVSFCYRLSSLLFFPSLWFYLFLP